MNRLSKESSPYLLQHAHNPVDWHPWGEEALTLARTENKPILVSIGYSACHWCHVMEKESFENPHIAEIMNRFLVCIKVDREERPDIDAIYMDAVQAMGVRGGWPLNVFLMPNAQPFYGLTYLPPQNWAQLLMSIEKAYTTNFDDLKKSAEGFTATLQASETAKYGLTQASKILSIDELDSAFEALQRNFDQEKGGMDRAPKFPMPSIYTFLLRYYDLSQNPEALRQVELSLNRIALGGIYDHVGGGWARYSVDDEWFIPHFEKMLYDNAQLLSVYAQAFKLTKQPLYRQRITQTIQWLQDEMAAPDGGFYSALDADSEGIEGKFYIWTKAELEAILGEDYHWFAHLYNISEAGNWEHGFNHLHLTYLPAALLELHEPPISMDQYEVALQKLAVARQSKIRPGTDDKVLASWNGLLLKGLTDAYQATGDENTRQLAIRTGVFLKQHMFVDGKLLHSYKNGKASIAGFLEDYAAVAEGLTALYQITFDIQWLHFAQQLIDYTIAHFYNKEEQLFFFTDDTSEALIARKMELFDNVIPASNSIMAHALYTTGTLLARADYIEMAVQMASKTYKLVMADSQWVTNWAALHCLISTPTAEVVIAGDNQDSIRKDFQRFFVPNAVVMAPHQDLPLTIGKATNDTTLYVCYNKTCQMPVHSVQAALQQIEEIY